MTSDSVMAGESTEAESLRDDWCWLVVDAANWEFSERIFLEYVSWEGLAEIVKISAPKINRNDFRVVKVSVKLAEDGDFMGLNLTDNIVRGEFKRKFCREFAWVNDNLVEFMTN